MITRICKNIKEALEFQSELRKTNKTLKEVKLYKIKTTWLLSFSFEE